MIKQGVLGKRYTGIVNCATTIATDEGIKGLWKGNFTNVIRYFPT